VPWLEHVPAPDGELEVSRSRRSRQTATHSVALLELARGGDRSPLCTVVFLCLLRGRSSFPCILVSVCCYCERSTGAPVVNGASANKNRGGKETELGTIHMDRKNTTITRITRHPPRWRTRFSSTLREASRLNHVQRAWK